MLSSDLDICIEYTLEHRQTKLTTLIVIGTVIYLLLNFTVSKLAFFFCIIVCILWFATSIKVTTMIHTLVSYINKSDYYDHNAAEILLKVALRNDNDNDLILLHIPDIIMIIKGPYLNCVTKHILHNFLCTKNVLVY